MINLDAWRRSVPSPLLNLTRIVRSTRKALETVALDAEALRTCAQEQQAMLVDRCDSGQTMRLLARAAHLVDDGVVWIITGTDRDHDRICAEAERQRVDSLVHCRHESFRNADEWEYAGLRLYLSSVVELREVGKYNPRRREDVRAQFCPLFVVFDSDLDLCSVPFGTSWDPAWAVRDAMARLCAVQQGVPLLILTTRDHSTINPSGVQRAFGLSGLLYFDGSALKSSAAPGSTPDV